MLITTVFLTYSSYQTIHFNNFLSEQKDWRDDKEISSYALKAISRSNFTLGTDFLEEIISEMSFDLNGIITDVLENDDVSGLLSTNMYSIENGSFSDILGLNALNTQLENSLSGFISVGRMPVSSNEIVYINSSTGEDFYSLNNEIQVSLTKHEVISQNLTIVGIISNLEEQLYSHGYSKDLSNWYNYLENSEISIDSYSSINFLTTQTNFAQLFNYNNSMKVNYLSIIIDFDYNIERIKTRKLASYLTKFDSFGENWHYFFSYSDVSKIDIRFSPFKDLTEILNLYYTNINSENKKILFFVIPFVSVILTTLMETTNNNKQGFLSAFRLMKSNGIDKKTIRNLLFIICLIMVGIGVSIGSASGILVSFLIVKGFNQIAKTSLLFENLINSNYIYVTLVVFTLLTFGVFIFLNRIQKETSTPNSKKTNQKIRNTLRRIISIPEILFVFLGFICLLPGITGLIFINEPGSTFSYTPINYKISFTLYYTFALFGFFFVFLSVSQILSKVFIIGWTKFSSNLWLRMKNEYSLALKTLKGINRKYIHLLVLIFLICIMVYPGFKIDKSVKEDITINSSLASGCCDILISEWNQNQSLRLEIDSNSYVKNSAEIELYKYRFVDTEGYYQRIYTVNILAICNITQFIEVVDFSKLNNSTSEFDLYLLEEEGTYLMSSKHANLEKYSSSNILRNSDFSDIKYEYTLEFINSFDFFPLLITPNNNLLDFWRTEFNLITSLDTANALYYSVKDVEISESDYLLLDLNSSDNISNYANELQNEYQLNTITQSQAMKYYTLLSFNFTNSFLVFLTIFSFVILMTNSFLVSRTVLDLKYNVIEIEHSIGATKNQIMFGLSFEIIVVMFIPLLISSIIGFLFSKYLTGFLFTSSNTYQQFEMNLSVGLLFLVILLGFSSIVLGSLLKIIPSVRTYYPSKQE
ncbi:MAG: FtsX-like permease family protein [Candidatus Thorarchaeota archaeon]